PHLEALDLGDAVGPHRRRGRRRLAGRRLGPAMVLELLLVLANLPVHLVNDEVYGLVHVLGGLDRLQDIAGAAGHMDGVLGELHHLKALVLLGAKLHPGLEDVVEMTGQFFELALCVGFHLGVGRGLLGLDQDLHGCLPTRDLSRVYPQSVARRLFGGYFVGRSLARRSGKTRASSAGIGTPAANSLSMMWGRIPVGRKTPVMTPFLSAPCDSYRKTSCIVIVSPSMPVISVMLVTLRWPSRIRESCTTRSMAEAVCWRMALVGRSRPAISTIVS